MFTLHHGIEATRVGEKRSQTICTATAHKCLLGDTKEIFAHSCQLSFFEGNARFRRFDFHNEVILQRQSRRIIFGNCVHLPFELVKLVQDGVHLVLDVVR